MVVLGVFGGTALDWPAGAYYGVVAAAVAVYFTALSVVERSHR